MGGQFDMRGGWITKDIAIRGALRITEVFKKIVGFIFKGKEK